MKINRRLSKKKTMAVFISALISMGASGIAHAVRNTPAVDNKGGSFTYIEPASGEYAETCPGPYEPLTITLTNNTDSALVNATAVESIWANIYYVPIDKRKYKGKFTGYAAHRNNKAFSREDKGVITPTGRFFDAKEYWNDKSLTTETSGPITGVIYDKYHATDYDRVFIPLRSWTLLSGGFLAPGVTPIEDVQASNPTAFIDSAVALYKDPSLNHMTLGDYWYNNNYLKDTIRVATISNIHNQKVAANFTQKAFDTVTLPMRSFRNIRIEVMAGINPGVPEKNAKYGTKLATGEVIAVWEAESVSPTDGTKMRVTESFVKTERRSITKGTGTGNPVELSWSNKASAGAVVNLITIDSINLVMKGTWQSKLAAGDNEKHAYYTGSKLTISPLYGNGSTDTDAPISMQDIVSGTEIVCN